MAIGRPGDKLPREGAAREYLPPTHVEDATWQPRVKPLLQGASTIVVMIGPTMGLHWELTELERPDWWSRTLTVVSPVFAVSELRELWDDFVAVSAATALASALRGADPMTTRVLMRRRSGAWETVNCSSRSQHAYKLAVRVALVRLGLTAPLTTASGDGGSVQSAN